LNYNFAAVFASVRYSAPRAETMRARTKPPLMEELTMSEKEKLNTSGKFEDTQPSALERLPGEDPYKLHAHLKAGLMKAASSNSSTFLQVKSSGKYVTINGSGWATLTDAAQTKFVLVPYYAEHYVVVASPGGYQGYYLSFNNYSYIGAYSSWNNARYWAVEPLNNSAWPGLYPYLKNGVDYVCVNGVKDGKFPELIEIYSA
jgi:hypothetical protein